MYVHVAYIPSMTLCNELHIHIRSYIGHMYDYICKIDSKILTAKFIQ